MAAWASVARSGGAANRSSPAIRPTTDNTSPAKYSRAGRGRSAIPVTDRWACQSQILAKAKSPHPDRDPAPSPCILKPSCCEGFGLPLTSPSLASGKRQYRLDARFFQDDPVVRKALRTVRGQHPDDTRGKLNSDRHLVIVRRHKGLD
jgi:hypothetical protein